MKRYTQHNGINHNDSVGMLSVITLNVFVLNVKNTPFMLNAIVLSVVAPWLTISQHFTQLNRHRSQCKCRERLGEIKCQHDFSTLLVLLQFHRTYKILFDTYLKHSSFMPSAHVKPMSNDLANAIHCECIFLSACVHSNPCDIRPLIFIVPALGEKEKRLLLKIVFVYFQKRICRTAEAEATSFLGQFYKDFLWHGKVSWPIYFASNMPSRLS